MTINTKFNLHDVVWVVVAICDLNNQPEPLTYEVRGPFTIDGIVVTISSQTVYTLYSGAGMQMVPEHLIFTSENLADEYAERKRIEARTAV